MSESSGIAPTPRAQIPTILVARLAERQSGVVGRKQLGRCGVSGTTISRWVAAGRLHRVHPGVYSVGHTVVGIRGRLVAALLYAGRGAALSHQTAAWWWGVVSEEPQRIHISTTNQPRSLTEIRVHQLRQVERTTHHGLPVTTLARTLLDLAATMSFADLRRALAEADYRRLLDPASLDAQLGRGRPGSAALRMALSRHYPELARTRSVLEERFLALVEGADLPMPEVNPAIEGLLVDAVWRDRRVVVELDGQAAHGSAVRVARDRGRELILRRAGYEVRRYGWRQVTREPESVLTDLRAALEN